MKFRKDFVTNSSSSSFLSVMIESEDLINILSDFIDGLLAEEIKINKNNNIIKIETSDLFLDDCPYELENVIDKFIDYILKLSDKYSNVEINHNRLNELIYKLEDADLTKSITYVSWEESYYAWGSKGKFRYDEFTYPDEMIKDIYRNILKENPKLKTFDDITEQMFKDYVSGKTIHTKLKYHYNDGVEIFDNNLFLES